MALTELQVPQKHEFYRDVRTQAPTAMRMIVEIRERFFLGCASLIGIPNLPAVLVADDVDPQWQDIEEQPVHFIFVQGLLVDPGEYDNQ